MEMPRGLIVILLLLSLGICFDFSIVWSGGGAMWIGLLLLAGRLAAIVGILLRNQVGWYLAIGFFLMIVTLNAIAAQSGVSGARVGIGLVVPVGCLVYLLVQRGEFGQ